MNMSGMYFMIFCWVGSMPGDGGVSLACQSMVAPMINGSRLKGKFMPGM